MINNLFTYMNKFTYMNRDIVSFDPRCLDNQGCTVIVIHYVYTYLVFAFYVWAIVIYLPVFECLLDLQE